MSDAGSLIHLHEHTNLHEVLDFLSDVEGKLYYKDAPIFIKVSDQTHNAIQSLKDGIFVDGSYFLNKEQYSMLTKFSFSNGTLYYSNTEISWLYNSDQLKIVNNQVWDTLNKEFPQDDYVTGCMLTKDNQIFVTANGIAFEGKIV